MRSRSNRDFSEQQLDEIIGRGPGDPDLPSGGRWVTGTKPGDVEIQKLVYGRQAMYRDDPDLADYDPRIDNADEKWDHE